MIILSLETSAKAASCALSVNGELSSLCYQNLGLTHSVTLLPMVQSMLNNCGFNIHDTDLIAVSCGPGSFTGVRIGCALAKGLIWSLQIPCCPVSTLEAMAYQAHSDGIICCVMDARRNEVYNALFKRSSNRVMRICQDRALPIIDLEKELNSFDQPVYLIGDGAEICFNKMVCSNIRLASEFNRVQNAWGVTLAAIQKTSADYAAPNPIYLRLSQAERELSNSAAPKNV